MRNSLSSLGAAPCGVHEAGDPDTLRRWRRDKNMVAFGLRPGSGAGPTVDCLIDPVVPFATLAENAVAKSIGELRIPIASIDDLIALKRAAGRAIDMADIEALTRLKQLGLDH